MLGETHLVVVQKHPSSLEIGSNVKGPIDSVWQNCPFIVVVVGGLLIRGHMSKPLSLSLVFSSHVEGRI